MKIEVIQSLWDVDCVIDPTQLGSASLQTSQLHAKYCRIYMREKVLLLKYKADFKADRLDKREFLINPTQQQITEKGWKIPPQGRLLKTEVNEYLDADKQLLQLELQIGIQFEKVEFVADILRTLKQRTYLIKNALDDRKFLNGD